jgi:uncharacterized protein YoxC
VNWSDVLLAAGSFAVVIVALGLAYALVRLAGTFERVSRTLDTVDDQLGPLLTKTNGTLDLVNEQLAKVDVVTGTAADAVTSVDQSVRSVVATAGAPFARVSGTAAGVGTGVRSFRARRRARRGGG